MRVIFAGLLFSATWLSVLANGEGASPKFRNTAPGVQYTGSKACAGCHPAIFRSYMQTGMGRSLRTVTASDTPQIPASVHDGRLGRDYRLFVRDGQVFQSESESNSSGTVFEQTYKLEYVIGSGANGMTYAVRRGDYLFQAPLSFYSKPRQWDLSPGYETTGEGFGRPMHEACIVCHSGRARSVPGRDGLFEDPSFAETAVGCENCHGPGALHVKERQNARPGQREADGSIVNPARLNARLADDICMKCHQGGAARVLLPGRSYADFRPGRPLIETVAIFDIARPSRTDSDLLEHHESMKLSKCYRSSGERMACITCHDPHQQPAPNAAPAYYRPRCLTCHEKHGCKLDLKARQKTVPADNCIGCHMAKKPVDKISHSVLTDHRIPVRPGAPNGTLPARQDDVPGLVLVNRTPEQSLLPVVTRLAAYGELMAREDSLRPHYLHTLEEAAHEAPDDPLVLAALGRKLLGEGKLNALEYLTRAEAAGTATSATYLDLSEALAQAGRQTDSVRMLEKGESRFPYSRDIRKRLILAYITAKTYSQAESALQRYVSDFPEDAFMRSLLNQAKSRNNSSQK